jgi:hypothetical protein
VIPLRERAKEEARSHFCASLNSASLNVPAAGYISDASNASFWNIDYYQHHFDVDTKAVSFPFLHFPFCYSWKLNLPYCPRSSFAVSIHSTLCRLPTLPPTSRRRPTFTGRSGHSRRSYSSSSSHPLSPTPSFHTSPRIQSSTTLRY